MNGEPLCFAYNLGSCTKAADGGRCDKGPWWSLLLPLQVWLRFLRSCRC